MTKLITLAAIICAVLTVLTSRLLIPALIICFRAIEQSFASADDTNVLPALRPVAVTEEITVAPVAVADVKPAPRKARRRKPSAATLARAEAALA